MSEFKNYIEILKNATTKKEICKYIFNRLFGKRKTFDEDVFIYSNNIILNCGRVIQNCFISLQTFEESITKVIEETEVGTFIDIGAHIGKFSVIANKLGYNTLSIEANPINFKLLNENIVNNNCDNAKTINMICSDKVGVKKFEVNSFYPACGKVTKELDMNDAIIKEYKCDSLDNIAKYSTNIKLIKIDVEGEEFNVLNGAKNIISEYKPKIIFEAWDEESKIEIEDFLSTFGYKVIKLDEVNYLAEIEK